MVITIKHEYASKIINGRRVHIDYEDPIKDPRPGMRDVGTFHCRVVGGCGWRRFVGVMLTDRTEFPARSIEGFEWARDQALAYVEHHYATEINAAYKEAHSGRPGCGLTSPKMS